MLAQSWFWLIETDNKRKGQVMTILKREILFALMILSVGTLAACNTIEGAGKDIKSGGLPLAALLGSAE